MACWSLAIARAGRYNRAVRLASQLVPYNKGYGSRMAFEKPSQKVPKISVILQSVKLEHDDG